MKQRWAKHRWVLGVLVILVASCDVLVWVHPSLGFAHGGILSGADLRGSLIKISFWLLLTFGLVASAALRALASVKRDALAYVLSYGSALVAAGVVMTILDRFY
jgi:hypothetical protein